MPASQQLSRLFGRRRFNIKPGLERIIALLDRYGHPERSFAAVHIVGTNGKGSTAAFLAAILEQAGYDTGLFTSPHLVSYTERFRINGADISSEQLGKLIQELLDQATPDDTFFELTTALACRWFAQNTVRIAVLEAGMGGRSDATAAVPGLCTVITPIALDHCQWLGADLQAIATEKVGIAAPATPIISAMQAPEVLQVLENYCRTNGNRLILAGRDFTIRHNDLEGGLTYQGSTGATHGLFPSLNGSYQTGNAALALAAAEQLSSLGFPVSSQAMHHGLQTTRWPGRMELIRLPGGSELLLDGAHNPAGAQALADALGAYATRRKILLLGMMEDKDLHGVLDTLLQQVQQVITVSPSQERAIPATSLADSCRTAGSPATAVDSVAAGLEAAQAAAKPGDLIIAAGSLFLVGELKALLAGIPCEAVRG
ncbi:MAG: bifunctional folylpolyglutamate synthase/dihydrofolate synthase [Geobacter sp.]|nr:bifunctional folylpolyglutamate synthase/dihydrofolate synthase [Geobacter sp.]